jgi:enamine deaminase RidA (YjgF/YER057c/UK114 family)
MRPARWRATSAARPCRRSRISKAALAAVGGTFEQVVKVNMYFTDIDTQLPIAREVRDGYVNTSAAPASTAVQISKLARDGALYEIEAVALLP